MKLYRFHRLSVYSEDDKAKDWIKGKVSDVIKILDNLVNTEEDGGIVRIRPVVKWSWRNVDEVKKLFDIVTRKKRSREYGKEIVYNLAISADIEEKFGRIMSPHIERYI